MELAVNMFTGGMVLDSHPLVQSSDTLSDALNATYITMNGNEVVLLNDMGNRRVDNAYLPAGYEPVGIKEYGGIIYIAAYNPITHRSLIGSFPSPERNMGIEYEDNGINFDFNSFLNKNNLITPYGNEIRFIKNDVMLLPLTKDTSLHAGDKFTVYSDYIWNKDNRKLITNFGCDEHGDTKRYTSKPFNKEFTLSLGILNSQNEFADITPTLQRFNRNGKIIKGLNNDYDKFNIGYFIAPADTWTQNLPSSDNEILNERNKIGANTYAYKLTGPLFLKVELNHIQLFNYDIETSIAKVDEERYQITFFVTGTATYNCPFPENNDCFDLYVKDENNLYKIPSSCEFQDDSESTVYDSVNDNYISSVTKIYRYIISRNTGTLEYIVAVKNSYPNSDKNSYPDPDSDENKYKYYLSNLSEHSTIDISKIGTNSCELSVWKYKNNISNNEITSTLIDFKFDCYNDRETRFGNLSLILKDLTDDSAEEINLSKILKFNGEISNGRLQIYVEWDKLEEKNKIKLLHLYLVKINYNKIGIELNNPSYKTCRFLLATSLFNSCYDEINEDYVSDYGIFMGTENELGKISYTYSTTEYKMNIPIDTYSRNIRNKYLDISNNIDIPDPILLSLNKGYTLTNPLALIVEDTIDQTAYKFSEKKFNYGITVRCDKTWKINNLEQYPLGITIENGNTEITPNLSDIEFQTTTNKRYDSGTEYVNEIQNFDTDIVGIDGNINETSSNNIDDITFDIHVNDKIYFNFELDTKRIGISYVDVRSTSKFFNFIEESISENLKFNGITAWEHDDDVAWVFLCPYLNRNSLIQTEKPTNKKGDTYPNDDAGESLTNSVYCGLRWDDTQRRELFIPRDDGWKMTELYNERFLPALQNMNCPFTFALFDREVFVSPAFTCAANINKRDPDLDNPKNWTGEYYLWEWFQYNSGYKDQSKVYYADRYCRVWWMNEDGQPIILNNSPSSGIFDSGNTTSDREKLTNIYKGIIDFIGKVRVLNTRFLPWAFKIFYYGDSIIAGGLMNNYFIEGGKEKTYDFLIEGGNASDVYLGYSMTGFDIDFSNYNDYLVTNENTLLKYTYLVMPIRNKYVTAWYPSPSKYLYSDNTQTNLKYTVHYNLINLLGSTKVNYINNNSQNIANLLQFNIKKETIEKNKVLNKNFKISTSFSELIFNISQQLDLTSYSIDLEESVILSDKDPLAHLYIRSPYDPTKLAEVPDDYPIQLNSGSKYNFPLNCIKEYESMNNHITNEFQIMECRNLDTPRKHIRAELVTWPSSRKIPVLRDTDLVVNKIIFN